MPSIIDQLIDEGALVLYHDYRAGHCLDLSGQGNDGTTTATTWSTKGLQFPPSAGYVTVADAAELQLTNGALVFFGEFYAHGLETLIYKHDIGGSNYSLIMEATPRLRIYDGVNQRNLNTSLTGKRYLGVNMVSGSTAEGFVDGVSVGNFSDTSTFTTDDAPVIIGARHTLDRQLASALRAVLIINRPLTATEHAQLYSELSSLHFPRKSFAKAQGSYGDELVVDGDMEAAGTAAWTAGNNATLTKESNRVLGGDQVLRIAHNGTANPFARQAIMTAGTEYRITGWARGDGTGYPRIIDGALITVLWQGTTSTSWQYFDVTITAGYANLSLCTAIAVAGYCEFDNVSIREVYDTETQFKTDWNAQVSEANVAAGQIENTPFYISSGQWAVETDTIDSKICKALTCKVAGIAYIDARLLSEDPTQDAYGTWEWYMRKISAGSVARFHFISTTSAGAAGYEVRFQTNGAVSLTETGVGDLFLTPTGYINENQWYKVRVTRRQSDGQFTVYIDDTIVDPTGGSGTNPATDTTHTSSSFICFQTNSNAGDGIVLADITGDHCLIKKHGVIAP